MFEKLFRSASIYVLANIFNAAIPFLFIPLYTRYMSTEDYGVFSMFQLMVLFLVPIAGLSIHGAVARQYYEKDSINISQYITNGLGVIFINTLMVGVILGLFSSVLTDFTSLSIKWLLWSLVVTLGKYLLEITLVLYQVRKKAISFGVLLITQTLFNAVLTVFMVVYLEMGWTGAAYAQVISYALFGVVSLLLIYKWGFVEFKLNIGYVKHSIGFGAPLVPVAIGMVLMNMIDRIFIKKMVGIEDVGIYTVGYQIAMILGILVNSFNKAWVPWLFEKLKSGQNSLKVKIVKFTYIYFGLLVFLAIILGILSPVILSFYVSESFYDSYKYVFWLALGFSFNGMYKMMTNYVHYAQKTSLNFIVMLVAVPVNIALNYILIKHFGTIGAAQATAISFFVAFILMWALSNKVYKMPWFSKR